PERPGTAAGVTMKPGPATRNHHDATPAGGHHDQEDDDAARARRRVPRRHGVLRALRDEARALEGRRDRRVRGAERPGARRLRAATREVTVRLAREAAETRTVLAQAWANLPEALRTPTQFLGQHYVGCAGERVLGGHVG